MMDKLRLSMYKYSIEDILIIYSNGKKDTIKTLNIGAINIEKDFDENFFPILNISTSVSNDMYKRIAGDRNVKAKITINKIAIKAKEEFIDESPRYQEPIIDGIFKIQMNNTDLDPRSKIQRDAEEKIDNKAENNFNTELDLYLFLEEALNSKRDLDSMIFCDTDPLTAIVYLCEQVGVRRMLVSRPDNSERLSQIIVPETKILPMIKNIENVYGVYNYGSIFFYDFDKLYYISKDINNNASMENNEISLININFEEFATNADRSAGSYMDKENDRYYINSPIYPNFQNIGNFSQEVAFNDVHAINTRDASVDNKSIDFGASGKNKIVVDNKYENPFIINSKVNEMRENYYAVTLGMREIDISKFTPNKKYFLNFDIKEFEKSRKYTGTYRLCKIVSTLSKNGSDIWFESRSMCFFKKSKE